MDIQTLPQFCGVLNLHYIMDIWNIYGARRWKIPKKLILFSIVNVKNSF